MKSEGAEPNRECYVTRHESDGDLPLHRHATAYVALVVEGSYRERSVDGAFDCVPGTILVHPAHHQHVDTFGASGASVVNRDVEFGRPATAATAWLHPSLARANLLLHEPFMRLEDLLSDAVPVEGARAPDWMSGVVAGLIDTAIPFSALARRHDVSLCHASRSIRRHYGISPRQMRLEARWRRAMALLGSGELPVRAAVEAGFADQSHLTRMTRRFTGQTPGLVSASGRQTA